jgi:hypothetical protein
LANETAFGPKREVSQVGANDRHNRLLLLGAFLVCIAFGFGLALALKDRLGEGTAVEDPCFGQGELVGKWQVDVTQAEIDSTKGLSPQLADRKPGLTEFRTCKTERGDSVILDQYGHVFSFTQPTLAELESYYKNHPDLDPRNEQATAEAERRITDFVTPALPAPDTFGTTILAGCDPTWVKKDFLQPKLRLCYPPDWGVDRDDPAYHDCSISGGVISMTFGPKATREVLLDCADPTVIATPAGDARLCAYRPNMVEKGQGHDMALPNGHRATFFITDPSEDNLLLALRIALAAEDLP